MYKPYSTCYTWQRVTRSVSPLHFGSCSLAKQRLPQLVETLCLQQEDLEAKPQLDLYVQSDMQTTYGKRRV